MTIARTQNGHHLIAIGLKHPGFDYYTSTVFGWITRLLSRKYKRTLTDNDLDDLSHKDKSKTIYNTTINLTDWTKTTLRKVIIQNVWKKFVLTGFRFVPYLTTRLVQPLIMRQIFLLLEQTLWKTAYLYVLFLFVCFILTSADCFSYKPCRLSGTTFADNIHLHTFALDKYNNTESEQYSSSHPSGCCRCRKIL